MSWDAIPWAALGRAAVILGAGWLAARIVRRLATSLTQERLGAHGASVVRKLSFYAVIALFTIVALQQVGFDLSVLLGAAGIVTVAVGFASQTSASNLISGVFLLTEGAFSVGDVIRVDGITGEVLSVDLLSVKLRTFDNLFVRIPNEDLMKSRVTTLTRFPIRRYDMQVGIAYKEDVARARDVLLRVAREFHLCLEEPKPLIILQGFGESSIDIQFSVWAARERYIDVRNGLHERVKRAFDAEGIEIPFPHRTLYTGSETQPLPVRITSAADAPRDGS